MPFCEELALKQGKVMVNSILRLINNGLELSSLMLNNFEIYYFIFLQVNPFLELIKFFFNASPHTFPAIGSF